MSSINRRLLILGIFAVFMAYLESGVVVYLRALYYPEGFAFPLKIMPVNMFLIEFGREAATVVMLVTVAMLSGRGFMKRFLYFIYAFGVWDIFYYIWLKLFLNWPTTVMDNDLLFLIPVPWVSPVLAPIIFSIVVVASAIIFLKKAGRGAILKIRPLDVLLSLTGVVLVLFAFLYDALTVDLLKLVHPPFLWGVFIAGQSLLIVEAMSYGQFLGRRVNHS